MEGTQRTPLTGSEIAAALTRLPGWTHEGSKLRKLFSFNDYSETISFVLRIAFEAEALDHHPTLVVGYNNLKVTTCTHDAGNRVTRMDIALASSIEALYAQA